eukprot:CAMPEP_0202086118 /NCGR_PEP_ID=MMETSP0964-20121228/32563_1 /ASSEMBLY_ACC=CAM_ASM_000500 /TAXON_ID=4773 /ORGANISM="Schizochytrium aggregatum, Strain ATCC28209" /LENGTH=76 /DNA_ID=CAMNT_0048653995 /DNA_START=430 /DNA_END=660 /DNA_ORIENTATION=+
MTVNLYAYDPGEMRREADSVVSRTTAQLHEICVANAMLQKSFVQPFINTACHLSIWVTEASFDLMNHLTGKETSLD